MLCQINISTGPEITPEDMVEHLVGDGVIYGNVTFQGADISRGIFSNGDSASLGLNSGIFLTSGSGYLIPGPNTNSSTGTNNGTSGNATLNSITTSTTYDAAVLEFDFIPDSDTIQFRFVFGSEEYDEYVSTPFSDVCGIFVTGPNPAGGNYNDKNIALVPETNLAVNVSTINSTTNSQYFIDNTNGLYLEYDGFTTVLTGKLAVELCQTYHLKIGIADAGDAIYDSGVFLEENSIETNKIMSEAILSPPGITEHMLEGYVEADIVFKLPSPEYAPLTVNFEILGTANPAAYPGGDFEEAIPTSITFEEGQDSAVIHVKPIKDGIFEGEESLVFVIENWLPCYLTYDTVEFIILDYMDISLNTMPNTMICQGQEIELWANVMYGGFPPFSYYWDPSGFTNDTIAVSPDETTMYTVSCYDVFDTVMDSVLITVLQNYEIFTYSFEAVNNPSLPWDVIGQVTDDSIFLEVPVGTDIENLIASFTNSWQASFFVNGVQQQSGVTANDFTDPLVYNSSYAPGGCFKEYMVSVDVSTSTTMSEDTEGILFFPNPANTVLYIGKADGYELSILNNIGKTLKTAEIDNKLFVLDINDLSPGIYFFQLNDGTKSFTRKVLVD